MELTGCTFSNLYTNSTLPFPLTLVARAESDMMSRKGRLGQIGENAEGVVDEDTDERGIAAMTGFG